MSAHTEAEEQATRDAIAEHLAAVELYTCSRVWESWHYGTMGQDDFGLAYEDDDIVQELADLVTDLADERAQARVDAAHWMTAWAGLVAFAGILAAVVGWTVGA